MIVRIALTAGALFALAATANAQRTDLIFGMVLEPPHLDPTAGAAAAIDEVVYANVFEGLTRIGSDGAVLPGLAENWIVSDDGLNYTFELREGATFHDGTTLDAGDVVFSLERAMAEDSVNAQKALFAAIDTVEQMDELTVAITLSQPTGDFLYNMGWGDAVIVAPESADTNQESPVGTGPFRFVSWQKGSAVNLERYADYWGEAPALESVQIRFIPDPAAATAALLAGDVHAFPNLPAPESIPIFEADPRFTVAIGSTEGETILSTNNAQPPFDDIRVRQAIAHAIDRQAIIDGAMFGLGTPIGTHFAPHHPAYVELIETYPFDPDRARALLAEAGHGDGISATIHLPPPSYARRGGEIIASQLRDVGIDLEIIPVEWAQWLEQVFTNKEFDLTIVSHTEPNDIGIYARENYYFQYENADFDALIAELSTTANEDARYELWRQAQQILAEDAVNGFLFQLAKNGVWDARLEGLWENSPVQANDVTGVRWTE
ncbi:MAG: ABC transporter substrate-binding protein [Phyllobacteriaceae bacterium]|nr:ABC transporter substrate-binding protein [Phyllobacteriaceae bacterium]